VLVIAIAIIALSLLFKDAFSRVGAAPNPDAATASALSCSEAPDASKSVNVDLAAVTLTGVDGATVQADRVAHTGAVDFTRALAAEPDAAQALSTLDQSRFEKGYDRMFTAKKGGTIHLSTYQFKGTSCAARYIALHMPAQGSPSFTVDGVTNSTGKVVQGANKKYTATAWAPVGGMVVIAQWVDAPSSDQAKSAVQTIVAKQVEAIKTAVDSKGTTTTTAPSGK
jgi:hypothetical protein